MNSSSGDVALDAAQREWQALVGRFILAFGEVEYCLCQCLVHVPDRNIWDTTKNNDFKTKTGQAIKEIHASALDRQLKRRLTNVINRAIKQATLRNLVAHNPLHLAIYQDAEGRLDYRLEIYSLRSADKSITIGELAAEVTTMEALATDFHKAVRDLHWSDHTNDVVKSMP